MFWLKRSEWHGIDSKKMITMIIPSASEVAALIVRDPNEQTTTCDIIVDFKDMGPQRISSNAYVFTISLALSIQRRWFHT
jgi:hypothetical protein